MNYPARGDNAGLGYNFQGPQDMNCPCEVCHCGKPRGRKRKRHQYQAYNDYQPSTFQPCVHRFFKTEPVDRECLSHEQYMDMLATPKKRPWLGEMDFDNTEISSQRSKKRKYRMSHEEELERQEHGCKDFSIAEDFINDMWDVMTPHLTDRLIDFLVSEFGMTVEEAEDFIDCKSSVGKPTPCAKKQSKAIVSLRPKHKWVDKFSEVLSNRIEQYICSILMDNKSLRVQKMAKRFLNDMCGMTGCKTSLQYPKTKGERTMVVIATRLAFWFEDIIKDLDKPLKERPLITEEEESEEKEVPEEKEEREEKDEEGEQEKTDKDPPKEKEVERPEERKDKKPGFGEKAEKASSEEKSPDEEKTPILEGKSSEKETTKEENPIEGKHPEVETTTEEAQPTIEGKLPEDETNKNKTPILEGEPSGKKTTEEDEPMLEEKPSVEKTTEEEKPAEKEKPAVEEKPGEERTAEEEQSPAEEGHSEEKAKPAEKEVVAKEKPAEKEDVAEETPAEKEEVAKEKPAEKEVVAEEPPAGKEVVAEEKPAEKDVVKKESPNAGLRELEEGPSGNVSTPLPESSKQEPSEETVRLDEIPDWEEDGLDFEPRKYIPEKSGLTYEVRAKTGSTLQVQTLSVDTVIRQTAQARGLPVPPQRKVPVSESPLNLKSAADWVDWATDIANTADEWGKWLETRFTEAEKQLTKKRKHSDWEAWMDETQSETLKWRVEDERIKEEGEKWSKKFYYKKRKQSEKILKTTNLL